MTSIMETCNLQCPGSPEAAADDVGLSELECHFKWLKDKTTVTDYYVNKILKDIEDNPTVLLRGRLLLFYLYVTGHYEFQKVTEVENLIRENIDERISEASNPEYLQGLQYIMKANQAHVLMFQYCFKEAEDLVASLPSFGSLGNRSQAVIFACKTYALANSVYSNVRLEAVESARNTLSLDYANPEWHFSLALSLGRKRRQLWELGNSDIEAIERITQEEEKALWEAEKGGNECSKACRADLYREKAAAVFFSSQIEKGKKYAYTNKMNAKSLEILEEIYKELSSGELKSLSVVKRLAWGFVKLPKSFKKIDYAEKCFEKALHIIPNCARTHEEYGYFLQCISYVERACTTEILSKAVEHLKLSWLNTPTNITGFIKYVCLRKQVEEDYNPGSDFYKILRSEGLDDERKANLLSVHGDYLQMIGKTSDAIRNWKEALRLDPHGRNMKYNLPGFNFPSNSQNKTTNFKNKLLDMLEKEVENALDPLDKANKKMDVAWFHRTKKPSGLLEELQALNEAESLINMIPDTTEMVTLENELRFQLGEALYKHDQVEEAHSNFSRVTHSYKNKEEVNKYLGFCNYQIARQRIHAPTSNEDKKAVLPILRESIKYGCLDACLLLLEIIKDTYGSRGRKEFYEGLTLIQTIGEGFSMEGQKEVLKDKLKNSVHDVLTFGLSPGLSTVGFESMRKKRREMTKEVLTSENKEAQTKLIVELLAESNFCLDAVCGYFDRKYFPDLYEGKTRKSPQYPRIPDKKQYFSDKDLLKDYVRTLLQKMHWSMYDGVPFEEKFSGLFNAIIESLWKKEGREKHLHKVWFQLVNGYKHRGTLPCQEELDYYYCLAHEAADMTEDVVQEFWKAMEI